MASKRKVSRDNLEAMGARRLAELLMDFAENDSAVKRRLRLELAATVDPESLAAEVRKRLGQIARARAFVDRRSCRGVSVDLETQRRTIVDQVAKIDPADALDLMWRFVDLAEAVQERCDDSDGVVSDVFHLACGDLATLAQAARPDPIELADRVFAAVNENGYGQYDGLIEVMAPALGDKGLDILKARFTELSVRPVEKLPQDKRKIIGWGMAGPMYEDEIEARRQETTVRLALQEIADAQGDVDAFIAQYDEQAKKMPRIAATIARRLLAADRAEDALQAIEAAEHGRSRWSDLDLEDARIDTLEALARSDEAQAARWSCFEHGLSGEHLRAYLRKLPDFEDVGAEERALEHVERSENLNQALTFLVSWPAMDRAARLIVLRVAQLDGDHYEVLSPAAAALADRYPLAATLLLRAMIDFALTKARSSRYRHAARHFMECASLASSIPEVGAFETHGAYAARLKAEHGRKSGFWSLVS
jgi:hypothetical protein